MPAIADFTYAVLFALGWPLYDYFVDWPTFKRRLRDDPTRARPRAYRNTALRQWTLVAIGVALWQRAGRPWSALALEAPSGWRFWIAAGVLVLIASVYASQIRAVARPGAGLWMRIDGNGGSLAFDNMMTRAITGTTDWINVSVVLDVPDDATGIAFGFLLGSPGDAWIDDASLEVVGTDVKSTNMAPPSPNPATAEQQRMMYAGRPLGPVNMGFEPVR